MITIIITITIYSKTVMTRRKWCTTIEVIGQTTEKGDYLKDK